MHAGWRVVDKEVVGHGNLGVSRAILSGPVHVLAGQRCLGAWDVKVGDLKALLVMKDSL